MNFSSLKQFLLPSLGIIFLSVFFHSASVSAQNVSLGSYYIDGRFGAGSLMKFDAFFTSSIEVDIDLSELNAKAQIGPGGIFYGSDDHGIFRDNAETGDKQYILQKEGGFFDWLTHFSFESDTTIFVSKAELHSFSIYHFDIANNNERLVLTREVLQLRGFAYDPFRKVLWISSLNRGCPSNNWRGCMVLQIYDLKTGSFTEIPSEVSAAPVIDKYGSIYIAPNRSFNSATKIFSEFKDDPWPIVPVFHEAPTSAPYLGLSSKNVFFKYVKPGDKQVKQFTFFNHGTTPLTINIIGGESPFSTNLPDNLQLASGEVRTFDITFEPTAPQDYEHYLKFYSNDPLKPADSVRLTGAGYQMNLASTGDGIYAIKYSYYEGSKLMHINPVDQEINERKFPGGATMAINSKGEVYSAGTNLYRLDPKSGATEYVNELYDPGYDAMMGNTHLIDMDFDKNDDLVLLFNYYGGPKGTSTTYLSKYVFATGELTRIGNLDSYYSDMAIHKGTNTFYFVALSELFRMDGEEMVSIGPIEGVEAISSIFFDSEGSLLGIDKSLDCCAQQYFSGLFHINKRDGSTTRLMTLEGQYSEAATISTYRTILALEEDQTKDDITVFPNPSTVVLTVLLSGSFSQADGFRVVDLAGREMLTKNIDGSSKIRLDLGRENIPAGVYLLEVRAGASRIVKKIIVQ